MMLRLTFSLFVPLLTATPVFAQVKVDKNLPEYKKSAKAPTKVHEEHLLTLEGGLGYRGLP